MGSRNLSNHGIRVASALALLLAVLTSPIRPPSSDVPPGETYLRRNFALLASHPIRLSATTASPPERVKAIRSLKEDDLSGATVLVRPSFGPARPFPCDAIPPAPALGILDPTAYPLRC
jgi:hypothetical protein